VAPAPLPRYRPCTPLVFGVLVAYNAGHAMPSGGPLRAALRNIAGADRRHASTCPNRQPTLVSEAPCQAYTEAKQGQGRGRGGSGVLDGQGHLRTCTAPRYLHNSAQFCPDARKMLIQAMIASLHDCMKICPRNGPLVQAGPWKYQSHASSCPNRGSSVYAVEILSQC